MAKERNFNPAQAHHKAEKAKAIRKGKAEIQTKRNEKLVRRNPNRIQRQIDDLEAIVSSGGALSQSDEQTLEELKKDLRSVNKARDALGDKAPTFGGGGSSKWNGGGGGGVLGKRRRRDDEDEDDSVGEEDVAEDVRKIPMPRDTPPPIPKAVLDRWWTRRRARRNAEQEARGVDSSGQQQQHQQQHQQQNQQRSQNDKHDDDNGGGRSRKPADTGAPGGTEPKTVYSSQPVLRNLRKEAVAFVPTAVRMNMASATEGAGTKQQNGTEPAVTEQQDEAGLAWRSRQAEVEDLGDDVDE